MTINDATGSVLCHNEFAMHLCNKLLFAEKKSLDAYGSLRKHIAIIVYL